MTEFSFFGMNYHFKLSETKCTVFVLFKCTLFTVQQQTEAMFDS